MRWDKDNESPDVEDRRGQRAVGGGGIGGVGLLFSLVSRFGWKGGLVFAVIAGVGYFLLRGETVRPAAQQQKPGHDEVRAFVGSVLDDAQKMWAERLPNYEKAHVVLFSNTTATGCGVGQTAVGPFYCPRDEKVYLDVTFFQQLHDRYGAPGDFARAYVIAHELGHHVQRLKGMMATVERASPRERVGEGGLSVRLELQADCYAGVWAHSAEKRGLLEPGDIQEAMKAAAAIGDDRLQKQATGTVQPERWTHGSAAERTRWFERGHRTGDAKACDTFNAPTL